MNAESEIPFVSGKAIAPEVRSRVLARVASELSTISLARRIEESLDAHAHWGSRAGRARAAVLGLDGRLRQSLAEGDDAARAALVATIVDRYLAEIRGELSVAFHRLSARLLPLSFDSALRALGGAHGSRLERHVGGALERCVQIGGSVARVRELARRSTLVLAPTHVSNLDAVLLGWVAERLGLPAFAYAAGLNLFANPVLGFFMHHLGAYTVDRDNADPLYRLALKEYTAVLLEHGQNVLFFPGGTRSRSGSIERKLKLGLLGTLPLALEHVAASIAPRPIHVVPCTLTYPLVLEAESLIADHLRGPQGGPRDESERATSWVAYLRAYAERELVVEVQLGEPIAVGGGPDARTADAETYSLADRIVEAFRRDTVVLPGHLLAFTLFELLAAERSESNDVDGLLASLRSPGHVALDAARRAIEDARVRLEELAARGEVTLSNDLRAPAASILDRALDTLGAYHRPPVVTVRDGALVVTRPPLLLYYRNRLEAILPSRARSAS